MGDFTPEIKILRSGQAQRAVSGYGTDAFLLSSMETGTEIIKYVLAKELNWYILPEEGWDGSEFVMLLSGQLSCTMNDSQTILHPGDSVRVATVTDAIVFTALADSEFLYVSSQPVFQNYADFFDSLINLAVTVDLIDGGTTDHCYRIRSIAHMVGQQLNLSSEEINRLNYGSFFHDVGKSRVAADILQQPRILTDAEFEQVKLHTVYGKEMLVETGLPVLSNASAIVEQHHERYDGSGYPYGLKGDDIDICAAVVGVVDSYDAMVSDRVYKKARSHESAITEISENRNRLYHPEVVDAFMKILDDINQVYQKSSGRK